MTMTDLEVSSDLIQRLRTTLNASYALAVVEEVIMGMTTALLRMNQGSSGDWCICSEAPDYEEDHEPDCFYTREVLRKVVPDAVPVGKSREDEDDWWENYGWD